MKKIITALLSIFAASLIFAETDSMSLLKKVDENTAFNDTDFFAKYTIVQNKPGEGKSEVDADIYRRDGRSSFTIILTGPSLNDKGKGYVQYDSNIWYYDPKDDQFVFTESRNKFQGTNAMTADFTPQHYSRDYKIESADKVKLGSLNCILFTLKAKSKKQEYQMIKLWVTENDLLIRKREDYSLSGQILRTLAMPSYQTVGTHSVPVTIVVQDHLKGKMIDGKMQYERTQINISNVSFVKQSDSVYTKQYIQMSAKK